MKIIVHLPNKLSITWIVIEILFASSSRMKAPECVALILEPESRLYEDPVIVLDFQSLYPSMMIGYNYCFSTCLGRVEHIAKYVSRVVHEKKPQNAGLKLPTTPLRFELLKAGENMPLVQASGLPW